MQEGLRKGDEKAPIAMKTQLEWILFGNAEKLDRKETFVCLQADDRMNEQMKSFWEFEEPPHVLPWSFEDQLCEKHYQVNTICLSDGRYQVRLPMKPDAPSDWVNSHQIAHSCLLSLERKLGKNPSLYAEYRASIQLMIKSDQMRKVSIAPQNCRSHYFLPHHAVVKESSTTTYVRPVFNASARNEAGHSLNEHLMTGPNLLPQLILVLAHWRCYPVAFVADVSKMYLQVRIYPDDWKFQSIIYRDDPKEEIENYVLTTVTFGSGPSAFLANRALRQLASDEGEKYPLAVPIVHKEMYMDDFLFSAYDVGLAKQKRDQLSVLFVSGGFSLAKWMTNDSDLLSTFSFESLAKEATLLDCACFNLTEDLMQSLCLLTKDWDVPLPDAEVEKWRAFEGDLKGLPSLVILRWNGVMSEAHIELHGFADASKCAYAAALYVRVIYQGRVRVNLLASKAKVAPLKIQSIPRLELCAVHLLTKLIASFAATEDFVSSKIHLWSDPKTTLHWIHDGLLRVGGQLKNAHISDECKHQVILPAKCRLVELLDRLLA
uniref:Reverse transcriptase domain-containing protein n=1 Tax=Trichogramma kaykai TaxID=54128 RepID=A0ABD2WT63_9HYME